MHPARRADREKWWWLALGLGFLLLLYFLSPILTPFLLGGILAYIMNPLVGWLERHRVDRTIGAVVAIALLAGLVVLWVLIVVPLFTKEIRQLIERLPDAFDQANTRLVPWLRERFGVELQLDPASVRAYFADAVKGTEGVGAALLQSLRIGSATLIGFLITALLIPVVLFYLMRDWNRLIEVVDGLVPRNLHPKVAEIARETDAVLAEFLRGQLSVMLVMSFYYSIALWVAGLDFYLPVGIITGILVFIPYVGSFTGLLLATLSGLIQFGPTMGLVWVLIAFGIGQAIEGMAVTPLLVGKRIGLHPVAVIFALLAFGQLFGFVGVLLALPASAALLVGLRHLRARYIASSVYGGDAG
ncbi:MAG TPA: AI-2E family transporter [Burkholderiales bacterium]|jgi:predicted PurR-regulated permease PerM|nr:AI-2E family transporter [Burkholderiales bacterium]